MPCRVMVSPQVELPEPTW